MPDLLFGRTPQSSLERDALFAHLIFELRKSQEEYLKEHINIEEIIATAVQRVLAEIPTPKDGDSPDPEAIQASVLERVLEQMPQPAKVDMEGMIETAKQRVLAEIPTPKDGDSPDPETIVGRVLELIPKPKEIKPLAIDHEKIADLVVEKISKGKKLKIEHVAGLKEEVASYRNQLAGKVYGRDTWARGGGDTVVAGTNVSFTKDANGNKVINATGGSSATPLTPTGTIDGSNLIFGTTGQPSSVIADGATFFEGVGYSYAANQITFVNPPTQYIRYYL